MTLSCVWVMTCCCSAVPSARVLVTVWVVVLTPSARAVVVAVTVSTTSRTVSMVWLTVRLPSAAMVSTVLMSLSTPSTIWRLVEVMTCFCWVVPLERVSVTVSVVFVTPSLTAVVVSEMDLTISADACFVLLAAFWAALAAAEAADAASEVPEELPARSA